MGCLEKVFKDLHGPGCTHLSGIPGFLLASNFQTWRIRAKPTFSSSSFWRGVRREARLPAGWLLFWLSWPDDVEPEPLRGQCRPRWKTSFATEPKCKGWVKGVRVRVGTLKRNGSRGSDREHRVRRTGVSDGTLSKGNRCRGGLENVDQGGKGQLSMDC